MADEKKIKVDTGLKVALKTIGVEEIPESVSEEEYEELSGKVSQGVRLRMQAKAKEQNMVMMWKSRVNLIKHARQCMTQKDFSSAAVAYEKYIKVLEMVYNLKPGDISPNIFNKSAKSKELTVITSVYWDLVRIYDTSPSYGPRMDRAVTKLIEFLPFSTVYPQIIKAAQSFQKGAKNPDAIRRLLKSVKASRGGCFIATYAYDDAFHNDLAVLRKFRDEQLSESWAGRCFISIYYFFAPRLILYFPKHASIKNLIKSFIQVLVRRIKI